MGVECASCGQVIPSGQFRCGNCGAVQASEITDDFGGLTEVAAESAPRPRPPERPLEQVIAQVGPARAVSEPVAPGRAPNGAETSNRSVVPAGPASQRAIPPPPPAHPDDEAAVREPLVPRGTFASEVPDRTAHGDEYEIIRGEPPQARTSTKPHAPSSSPPSLRPKSVRPTQKPPYLASEILREDLTPSEPGWRLMSLTVQLAPALGALAALSSGLKRTATWMTVAVLAALFSTARIELSYNMRALLVSVIGGCSLAVVTLWRVALGGSVASPLLAMVISTLPAALLFRAWFRASYSARLLVAITLVLAATWAAASSDRELLALEFTWQSWLPALTWYLFGLLCLLSLLAFMGDETTGGCDGWAVGLLIWYGFYALVRYALESTDFTSSANLQTLGLAEPALAAPTSIALAQLVARVLGARPPRATD